MIKTKLISRPMGRSLSPPPTLMQSDINIRVNFDNKLSKYNYDYGK